MELLLLWAMAFGVILAAVGAVVHRRPIYAAGIITLGIAAFGFTASELAKIIPH